MGKGPQTTTTRERSDSSGNSQIDPLSAGYINDFLRPLGRQGADVALNNPNPFFLGPTDTWHQGMQGLDQAYGGIGGLLGMLGGFQGRDYNQALRDYSSNIGDAGADIRARLDAGGGAGNLGFTPQNFDPSAVDRFFSPYVDNVVGGIQGNADRQREQAASRAAAEATAQGAFGGSRSGILQAESIRNVNQDEGARIADARNMGFQNAMQQALTAHQGDQSTGLQAAIAGMQGRGMDMNAALQAAGLTNQGQIANANLGMQRALGIQSGLQGADATGLQAAGLGLQGRQQQAAIAQTQAEQGEVERQIMQQMAQEPLFRQQMAMQLANLGFGQATGQNSSQRGSSVQRHTQPGQGWGGLLSGVAGLGMMASGLGWAPLAAGAVAQWPGRGGG